MNKYLEKIAGLLGLAEDGLSAMKAWRPATKALAAAAATGAVAGAAANPGDRVSGAIKGMAAGSVLGYTGIRLAAHLSSGQTASKLLQGSL
jgi:hypothetical protein